MKDETKNIGIVAVLLIFVLVMIAISVFDSKTSDEIVYNNKIRSFNSYFELKEFLKESQDLGNFEIAQRALPSIDRSFLQRDGASITAESGSGAKASDYSQTNVQVEGVDEADLVKNDGNYIYDIAGNKIVIVNALPASDMRIISKVEFVDKSLLGIFVNEDRLIVFAQGYETINSDQETKLQEAAVDIAIFPPYYGGESIIYAYIYDISDRTKPKLDKEISIEGQYINSRMIGDYVYIIGSKYVNNDNPIMPMLKINGAEERLAINDLYYFDYWDYGYTFNTINSINIKNGKVNSKVYLTGASNNLYVSSENIYLTYTKFLNERDYFEDMIEQVVLPIVPADEKIKIENVLNSKDSFHEKNSKINKVILDYSGSLGGEAKSNFDERLYEGMNYFIRELREQREKTVIHKIRVDEEEIEYLTEGEVKGTVLNQFFMDENNRYFRIATTSGEFWSENSKNNVYILNDNLEVIGKVEDLAPGERIYSARFIGDRAYLVTFKNIDPFYVIDLSDVQEPKVLGYLKIPGYSDYLHAYDENHIIGIGKDTLEVSDSTRDFVINQGLKIAIFDVRDVANPKESAKIIIGDRGTDSNALYDHKAFLFDKKRNLLVLPISLAKINSQNHERPELAYGETVWQGAYVFDIKEDYIKVKGQITHFDDIKKYGPASEELIGAKRAGYSGETWTKIWEDKWESNNTELYAPETATKSYHENYENIWSNEMIDSLPGGINHNPYYDYKNQVQRSLYIGDILYTLSMAKIKANYLDDLRELGKIELPYEDDYGGVIY